MYGSARAVGHVESSPVRSPRLPRSPRLGHRRAHSGSGGGAGGKTLSMENIQSLNAAYATSGPMYLSDHEGVGSTATYPKGTMTLGRATSRAMYGGRVTAMGSSPNIASVGLPHADLLSYSDLGSLSMLHPHHHQGVPSALLRQAVRGSGGELLEMQAQLREMQRENEMLRRELDLKDSKLGSSTNSIKSFWSPELKKERIMRKEEAARTSILKEQMRVTHEENQVRQALVAVIIHSLLQWISVAAFVSCLSVFFHVLSFLSCDCAFTTLSFCNRPQSSSVQDFRELLQSCFSILVGTFLERVICVHKYLTCRHSPLLVLLCRINVTSATGNTKP